jgi:hypothetical protein
MRSKAGQESCLCFSAEQANGLRAVGSRQRFAAAVGGLRSNKSP